MKHTEPNLQFDEAENYFSKSNKSKHLKFRVMFVI